MHFFLTGNFPRYDSLPMGLETRLTQIIAFETSPRANKRGPMSRICFVVTLRFGSISCSTKRDPVPHRTALTISMKTIPDRPAASIRIANLRVFVLSSKFRVR